MVDFCTNRKLLLFVVGSCRAAFPRVRGVNESMLGTTKTSSILELNRHDTIAFNSKLERRLRVR